MTKTTIDSILEDNLPNINNKQQIIQNIIEQLNDNFVLIPVDKWKMMIELIKESLAD